MATGVHSLSLVTNSYRKAPINPETGLALTENEKPKNRLNTTWHGFDGEFEQGNKNKAEAKLSKTVGFRDFSPPVQPGQSKESKDNIPVNDINPDLSNLTDDEFYKKLVELKEAHKKTLKMCETLYKQKLSESVDVAPAGAQLVSQGGSTVDSNVRNSQGTVVTVNKDFMLTPEKGASFRPTMTKELKDTFNNNLDMLNRSYQGPADMVRDMSASKPPRPKTVSGKLPQKRVTLQDKAQVTQSMDDYFFKSPTAVSDSDQSDEECSKENFPKRAVHSSMDFTSKSAAMSLIDDMWNEFSVDVYAPRTRPRSASLSRLQTRSSTPTKDKVKKEKEWKHRVTIPKPFNMTIRESLKEEAKIKVLKEYEKEQLEKQRQEELECQKKFKAKPVPAHVYMPLYDEIMEEKESRKRYIHNNRAKLLKSQEKPFNFTKKEGGWKAHVEHRERLKAASPCKAEEKKDKTEFKAKPFPSHIFDNDVMEKLQEEEEYRKIRMQMRSEELLQTASLPPTMKARGQDYVDGKSRQKMYAARAKKAHLTSEHKFTPRINKDVPEFDEIHRQFSKEMERRKDTREPTVVKPFSLRTEKIPSKKSRVYEDIERDENTLKEYRWPYMTSRRRVGGGSLTGSLSTSLDSIPAKMTQAAQLRTSSTKNRLDEVMQKELEKQQTERKKRTKQRELRKQVNDRAAANDKSTALKDNLDQKLKQYRREERERMEEYRSELDQMMDRVNQRPLLFEQTSQTIARQKAEKRYKDTLREAGIDEAFVARKGSGADVDARNSARNSARSQDSARSLTQDSARSVTYSANYDVQDSPRTLSQTRDSDLTAPSQQQSARSRDEFDTMKTRDSYEDEDEKAVKESYSHTLNHSGGQYSEDFDDGTGSLISDIEVQERDIVPV